MKGYDFDCPVVGNKVANKKISVFNLPFNLAIPHLKFTSIGSKINNVSCGCADHKIIHYEWMGI